MTGLKGIIGIALMITFGAAVFLIFAAVKAAALFLRFLNRRVLDQL